MFYRAIAAAGIDRSGVYVTNAVRHYQIRAALLKSAHPSKPDAGEITACRWWIEQERLLVVRPKVTVALGATGGARSLFGKVMTIGKERGRVHLPDGGEAWITARASELPAAPADRDAAELAFEAVRRGSRRR